MIGTAEHLAHLLPITASRNAAGHLSLGGCDVVELAHEYGTPLYVYDEETLRCTARAYNSALKRHYPASCNVSYASKAYTCAALLRVWVEEGLGLDVVGPGELEVALRAGFPPQRIHLHGNNKPPSLLSRAIEAGVGRVVVDGWRDLEVIAEMDVTSSVPTWLRVAPGVDAHTHHHRKTGLAESKFGFSLPTEAERAVEHMLADPRLELRGLHAHIGSQIFDVEPFVAGTRILIEFAATMRDRCGWVPVELSPGGGMGSSIYSGAQRGSNRTVHCRVVPHRDTRVPQAWLAVASLGDRTGSFVGSAGRHSSVHRRETQGDAGRSPLCGPRRRVGRQSPSCSLRSVIYSLVRQSR